MEDSYKSKQKSSALFAANATYVETQYTAFLNDDLEPGSYWFQYFTDLAQSQPDDVDHQGVVERFKTYAQQPNAMYVSPKSTTSQAQVDALVNAYRLYAHQVAQTNPLFKNTTTLPSLEPEVHGFSTKDCSIPQTMGASSLADLMAYLRAVYTGSTSLEVAHITNQTELTWLYTQFEKARLSTVSDDTKKTILETLTRAEGIEQYFAVKYVGQKRFSLEGGESLIPGLHMALAHAAENYQVSDVVMGMAHRGRLNVMLNICAMPAEEIFKEFEGRADYGNTSGDVKYHLGYSSDVLFNGYKIHISLMFNPSHLEFIAPVVNGSVRARQDALPNGLSRSRVMPVIIHGDAAMPGQGVVAETLNMSQTEAFSVGGSVHIIINNQVGFTAQKQDSMSCEYCSSVAKMINAPILHVNGDDPEAVVQAFCLAVDYRMRFAKDVVIDLVCYRRLGHNEADEPAATLPLLYQTIKTHPTTRSLYAQKCEAADVLSVTESADMVKQVKLVMDDGGALIKSVTDAKAKQQRLLWEQFINQDWRQNISTAVTLKRLKTVGALIANVPESLALQRQVSTLVKQRKQMASGALPLNWGMAELLAYATLLEDGFSVRIVGQDSKRGTFSHRHTILHDQKDGTQFNPFKAAHFEQSFGIYDSVLSETAPLGFEYGYSITNPNCLTIWEAQFGDFANGAQVIIDQFISSGWQKWKRLSGLVMLLPHGYEGMGPEHSSARLERFLQLAAQHNIQVCNPTTPAQIFHLLRRQMLRIYRKPLIIMTPKSILRSPQAASPLDALKKGTFDSVIADKQSKVSQVSRVILCSGKVYYDLLNARDKHELETVAIIRVEQLYPFPSDALQVILSRYKKNTTFVWAQEEPKNQGSWLMIKTSLERCLQPGYTLVYAGRDFSAAPAVGYPSLHNRQQQDLVGQALGLIPNPHEGQDDS